MTDGKGKCFSKFEYREAKDFLKDAVIVRSFHNSNVHSDVTYRKPDGTIWHESESHLESPHDDYRLIQEAD